MATESFEQPEIVLAGDFNFVGNGSENSLNRQITPTEKALDVQVNSMIQSLDLVDSVIKSK